MKPITISPRAICSRCHAELDIQEAVIEQSISKEPADRGLCYTIVPCSSCMALLHDLAKVGVFITKRKPR